MNKPEVDDASRVKGAARALGLMAARFGQHVTPREAEQAWQQVSASTPQDRLRAAWRWLYPAGEVTALPLDQRFKATYPVWIIEGGRIGVLLELPQEGKPWRVCWEGADAADWSGSVDTLWVASLVHQVSDAVPVDATPATTAIRTGLKAHRGIFVKVAVASAVVNVLGIVSSLFAMQVYDRVVPNFAFATLWVLSIGVMLIVLFDIAFKWVKHRLLESSAHRLDEALSLYFFERVLSLRLDRRPQRVGSLVAQVRDYESVKAFFTSTTLFALTDMPFVLLYLLAIFLIGGMVAVVPLVFVPVCLLIGLSVVRPLARLQKEQTDDSVRRTGALFEAIDGAETLKAQGGEWHFSRLWQVLTRQINQHGHAIQNLTAWSQFITGAAQQVAYVAVIIVGVYEIEAGRLTMGGLIACSILGGRALSAISQVTPLFVKWQNASYSLQTLNKILALPSDDDQERGSSAQANPKNLRVENVLYMYEGHVQPQLQVASLSIEQGARVAVLGRNGSGKSTLLRLLAGLATPNAGQVSMADIDLQKARQGWMRENIGYLPQDVRLFAGTLRENLLLGLNLVDDEQLRAVMVRTGMDTMVAAHPKGLDWPIREGGAGLSGGQRQLIGFTRLVLHDPAIWLLDEPSASLDQETEARIMQVLAELPADRTLIFTTHKPAWLKLARRVLAVADGKIAADVPAERARAATPEEAAAAAERSQRQPLREVKS